MPGSLEQVLPEVDVGNSMDKGNFVGMGAQTVVVAAVKEGDEADNLGIETAMLVKGVGGEVVVESVGPGGHVAQLGEHMVVVEVH